MYFRILNVLLVLCGLFLSSPTLKASFSPAQTLNQIYGERINFEKKLHKPFESFYSISKKKYRSRAIEVDVPQILNCPTRFLVYSEESSVVHSNNYVLNETYSYHLQRGPPVI